MTWEFVGQINLTKDWQVTTPVSGEIFRLNHEHLDIANKEYLKAVISSAFVDDGLNLLLPKRLSYREEKEVFLFYFPSGLASQQLAFKRLDESPVEWKVNLEVFINASKKDDFSNYIVSRFSEIMPLFNQVNPTVSVDSLQLSCISENKALTANTATLIADANTARQGLTVFNLSNQDVVLATGINGNQLVGHIAKISKDGLYELPISAQGCYTGKVYALSATAVTISVSQFIPNANIQP